MLALAYLFCNCQFLISKVVLELNNMIGTIIVLETMAFLHLLDILRSGITVVVSVDKLAVNLVASFTSELVIPFALLFTMCSMNEYQRSDPGSLKESILSLLNIWLILCLF